jgi:hypothetical protein
MVLHSFGWDDGVMVIAQVFALGAAAAIGLGWFYQALSESWRLLTLAQRTNMGWVITLWNSRKTISYLT